MLDGVAGTRTCIVYSIIIIITTVSIKENVICDLRIGNSSNTVGGGTRTNNGIIIYDGVIEITKAIVRTFDYAILNVILAIWGGGLPINIPCYITRINMVHPRRGGLG